MATAYLIVQGYKAPMCFIAVSFDRRRFSLFSHMHKEQGKMILRVNFPSVLHRSQSAATVSAYAAAATQCHPTFRIKPKFTLCMQLVPAYAL